MISPGSDEAASLLASQIPAGIHVLLYVDLGTGSGKTANASIQRLMDQGQHPRVWLVDSLQGMIDIAMGKIRSLLEDRDDAIINGVVADVLSNQQHLQATINSITHTDLITAQRVFINSRFDQRHSILSEWARRLGPTGIIIIDIPRLRRVPGAVFIRARTVNPAATVTQ